uniref:Uncharacterized protein n=1 Tax=Ciona intestinalis TaxID=7719 RepID=F6QN19_CIOIN
MSSRALRKLQGREVLMKIESSESESEEKDERNNFNKFSLLVGSDENVEVEETKPEIIENGENVTKNKRARKKKKKKKNKSSNQENEDIDKILDTFKNEISLTTSDAGSSDARSQKSVLIVEHRMLNPDNELRRIFGTRALMGDGAYRRRNQGVAHRGMWLSHPQAAWGRMSNVGVAMKQLETKDGCTYYKFEHNKEYQQVQFKFLDAVESSDHRNIA